MEGCMGLPRASFFCAYWLLSGAGGKMLALRPFTCQKCVKYPVCHKFKVGKELCAIDLHVKER